MNITEFNKLVQEYIECKNYFAGRTHSKEIAEIAKHGAEMEVGLHRDSILHDLMEAGLNIEEI